MDIKKATITELKSLAYDTLKQLETLQRNLQIINNEIQLKEQTKEEPNESEQKTNK